MFTGTIMLAQQLGADTGPPPPTDPPPELPLDNGILLLIIMGLVYGCYVATKRFQTSRTGA
jgi:hypothetical protein